MSKALPLLLSAAVWLSAADAPAPKDAAEILRRSLEHETFDLDPPQLPDYTYLIEDEEKKLNADGSVKSTSSETREAINLYGGHFERVVRKDGQALPPGKERAEKAKFDKAVEKRKHDMEEWQAHQTPELKAKFDQAVQQAKTRRQRCNEAFLQIYTVAAAGSEAVNGRAAWKIEMTPRPNAALPGECGSDAKVMSKFRLKVWIDQEEYRWARIEGDNIAPVVFGKVLFRAPTGAAYFIYEQVRHEDGVWLVSRDRLRAYARILLAAPFRVDETETYSGYRKYQAESRIVPEKDR